MAKAALLSVLETTIGRYVLNLDADNLNVAIWSGVVELNDVELNLPSVNTDLLQRTGAATGSRDTPPPFRVVAGSLSRLQLRVPWTKLTSQPVVVQAQGLYLVVEPLSTSFERPAQVNDHNTDQESLVRQIDLVRDGFINFYEKSRQRNRTLSELAKQQQQQQHKDDGSNNNNNNNNNTGILRRLVVRIIENLQIEIRDVHIALHHSESTTTTTTTTTTESSSLAAGIVLESLSLVTTDETGQVVFVDRTDPTGENTVLHKSLDIQGFGIYLEKTRRNNNNNNDTTQFSTVHDYILKPLSWKATLRQSSNDDDNNKNENHTPKYRLQSTMSSLSFCLSRQQLELGNQMATGVVLSAQRITNEEPLFPQFRPIAVRPTQDAAAWWRYAHRCVLRLLGKRNWHEFWWAFQKRQEYMALYKRHVHADAASGWWRLSPEEETRLRQIEMDRNVSLQGLMMWRDLADAQWELEKSKQHDANHHPAPSSGHNFLSFLFGAATNDEPSSATGAPVSLTPEERRELEAINNTALTQQQQQPVSAASQSVELQFVLESVVMDIVTQPGHPIVSLQMGRASVAFTSKADGSVSCAYRLSLLKIVDSVTVDTIFPNLCRPKDKEQNDIVMFHLEMTKSGDGMVSFHVGALEVVASSNLLLMMKDFFTIAKPVIGGKNSPLDAKEIADGLVEATQHSSEQVAAAIVEAWKQKAHDKSQWKLDGNMGAPVFLMPEDSRDMESNLMVVDMGRLQLNYGTNPLEASVEAWFATQPKREIRHAMIDAASFSVHDITLLLTKTKSYLDGSYRNNPFSNTVLDPISVTVDAGVENVVQTRNPRLCVIGEVPSISLRISSSSLAQAVSIAMAWKDVLETLVAADPATEADLGARPNPPTEKAAIPKTPTPQKKKDDGSVVDNDATALMVYASMSLRRVSCTCVLDAHNYVEANLVYLNSVLSQFANGSLDCQVRMGWFWVHDGTDSHHHHTRQNRLLAHSALPDAAGSNSRDVLRALTDAGVFQADFSGACQLAKVSMTTNHKADATLVELFGSEHAVSENGTTETVLDAEFAGFFLHLNPNVISKVVRLLTEMVPQSTKSLGWSETPSEAPNDNADKSSDMPGVPLLRLKVTVTRLQLSLDSPVHNSALFVFTANDIGFRALLLSGEENARIHFTIDGVNCTSPRDPHFVMLSSGSKLLSVTLVRGPLVLKHAEIATRHNRNELLEYATGNVGPLSYTHSESHMETLAKCIAYASETLVPQTEPTTKSAAAVALERLPSTNESDLPGGRKVYVMVFHHVQALLPFSSSTQSGGILANVDGAELELVQTSGASQGSALLRKMSVRMGNKPMVDIPSATVVFRESTYKVEIQQISTNLTHAQLECLRNELRSNDTTGILDDAEMSILQQSAPRKDEKTESPKSMCFRLQLDEFMFRLCAETEAHGIMQMAASDLSLLSESSSVDETSSFELILRELLCSDIRSQSSDREFTSIMSQQDDKPFISVLFTRQSRLQQSRLRVAIGSPTVTLVPDFISELLSFVSAPNVASEDGEEEKSVEEAIKEVSEQSQMSVQFGTETIRVVMVDSEQSPMVRDRVQTTNVECLVLDSQILGSCNLTTDSSSILPLEMTASLSAKSLQVFCACGNTLSNAVQVVEPWTFALNVLMERHSPAVDLNIDVSTSEVEAFLSTKNIALVSTLLSTLTSHVQAGETSAGATTGDHKEPNPSQSDARPALTNLKMRCAIPKARVCVINDLCGADEALFRLAVEPFETSVDASIPADEERMVTLEMSCKVAVLGEFFDAGQFVWRNLLEKPWQTRLKVSRKQMLSSPTAKFSTELNVDFSECAVCLSDQFLGRIQASSVMWTNFLSTAPGGSDKEQLLETERAAQESSLLPYAIENHTGVGIQFLVGRESSSRRFCPSESFAYFQFEFPVGKGKGGSRLYGKETNASKALAIHIEDNEISVANVDEAVDQPMQLYTLSNGYKVTVKVRRNNWLIIVNLGSLVAITNLTSIPLKFETKVQGRLCSIGTCNPRPTHSRGLTIQENVLGIPITLLEAIEKDDQELVLHMTTELANNKSGRTLVRGKVVVPSAQEHLVSTTGNMGVFEVTCQTNDGSTPFVIVLKVASEFFAGSGRRFMSVVFQPRSIIYNALPLGLKLTTMQQSYSPNMTIEDEKVVHSLSPNSSVECFASVSSLAFGMTLVDSPVTGRGRRWTEPINMADLPWRSMVPVDNDEKDTELGLLLVPPKSDSDILTVAVNPLQVAVDHMCGVTFWKPGPLGGNTYQYHALNSHRRGQLITLLPENARRIGFHWHHFSGAVFAIEDVSICEGGIQSTPLRLSDKQESGLFAYRRLVDNEVSEIHVVPEYAVFNGSKTRGVTVLQGSTRTMVGPGETVGIFREPGRGYDLSLHYDDLVLSTRAIQVDRLSYREVPVNRADGTAVGNVIVQISSGSVDSRMVIKVGEVSLDDTPPANAVPTLFQGVFSDDNVIGAMQFARFILTLNQSNALGEQQSNRTLSEHQNSICSIAIEGTKIELRRPTDEGAQRNDSKDKSLLSLRIREVEVLDKMSNSVYPIIFSSTKSVNILEMTVSLTGPWHGGVTPVELMDVSLARTDGSNGQITMQTSEKFVWKLLDVVSRIYLGPLKQNIGSIEAVDKRAELGIEAEYNAPKPEGQFRIALVRISPCTFVVSFKRDPEGARYATMMNSNTAKLVRYFLTRLKFTLDKAELRYSRYMTRDAKGTTQTLMEGLVAVYLARTKLKLLTILAATSFDDWKGLASRQEGDDEFVEGDILRVTGNLAGNAAGYLARNLGRAVGQGVENVTCSIGGGIEGATALVGAGTVGAKVNNALSGVGTGVNQSLSLGKWPNQLTVVRKDCLSLCQSGDGGKRSAAGGWSRSRSNCWGR